MTVKSETFKSTISGIPCVIQVNDYEPATPAYIGGLPEDCYPEEPEIFEFEVLDRKGYSAAWLERKLTDEDCERLFAEYESILKREM